MMTICKMRQNHKTATAMPYGVCRFMKMRLVTRLLWRMADCKLFHTIIPAPLIHFHLNDYSDLSMFFLLTYLLTNLLQAN